MRSAILVVILTICLLTPNAARAQGAIAGLESAGPDPALKAKLDLFGQFVGDWVFDVTLLRPDGSRETGSGEWHFAWVLEGRAIQDVWIAKYQPTRTGDAERGYGTTLRFYDPKTDAWRVTWISPLSDTIIFFTARKVADEIVMDAKNDAGGMFRWIFSEITPSSFHWRAVGSRDRGKTWLISQEFSVHRVDAVHAKQ